MKDQTYESDFGEVSDTDRWALRRQAHAISSQLDIFTVFKHFTGKHLKGKRTQQVSCPFHGQDIKPSARLYHDTNKMYCYVCNKVWDIIGVSKTFLESDATMAIQYLVKEFSLAVPESIEDIPKQEPVRSSYDDYQELAATIKTVVKEPRGRATMLAILDVAGFWGVDNTQQLSIDQKKQILGKAMSTK